MKIVVLDGYVLNPGDLSWSGLEALGTLTVHDRTAPKDVVKRIGDAEVILTNKTLITKEILDACPQLRYIGVLATGFNVVDTSYAKENGVQVTNIPAYSTQSVAQLVFALLLEICHHVGAHSQSVFEGKWQKHKDFAYWDYPLIELANKTMGIIGYGQTGQAVAKIADAFGMHVIAYNPSPRKLKGDPATMVELHDIYAEADVISLHTPLLPETTHLINKESIARMKDGVILINTSRGAVIHEGDVADALDSGRLFAVAVDVVSDEPIRANNPLLKAKNSIITPHIAWAPLEARTRLLGIAVSNLKGFLDGKPVNVVNA